MYLLWYRNSIFISLNPETPCFEGTVQLSGGMDRSEGRIEVCSNGVWGTICGSIDVANAATVCKQLGYQNPSA